MKLHITELASPARALDLENSFPVSILDCEPWIYKSAVLLDVANSGANRGLDLHFLKAAEAAPGIAAIRPDKMDYLHQHTTPIQHPSKLTPVFPYNFLHF